MALSYSLHLSNKKNAVANKTKVGQVSKHNLREYKSDNYDKTQIEILCGSDKSILDDMKEIYHREFDEALKNYNSKQTRSDRKIDNYFDHVSQSRSDVAAEVIIQVGDKDFWQDKTIEQKKQMSYIFRDQIKGLAQLCPDFKVVSAVVHYDESSPHMHIIGVPVAHGYEKGMETQCAKTKVFTQDSLKMLQDRMRQRAERGILLNPTVFKNTQLQTKQKGRNKDIPKHSLDKYYGLQKNIAKQSIAHVHNQSILDDQTRSINTNNIDLTRLQQQIKIYYEELSKAKQTLDNLRVDIDNAEQTLNNKLENVSEAEISLSVLTDDINSMAQEKFILKGKLDDIRSEKNKLEDDLAHLAPLLMEKKNLIQGYDKDGSHYLGLDEIRQRYKEMSQAYEDLKQAKMSISDELGDSLNRARFVEITNHDKLMSALNNQSLYAKYQDKVIGPVKKNARGGIDLSVLENERCGLCKFCTYEKEPIIKIPRNILHELVNARDRSITLSDKGHQVVDLFSDRVQKHIDHHKDHEIR